MNVCVCAHSVASVMPDSETPWTVACQAPLSMGFSRQEYWNGLLSPPPGDLPDPGIESLSLVSPALAGRFFACQRLIHLPKTDGFTTSQPWLTSTTWEAPLWDTASLNFPKQLPLFLAVRTQARFQQWINWSLWIH